MRHTIVALGMVSLSFAAFAVPPGPPAGGPVSVSIAGPLPLPVTSLPSWTAPERMYFSGTGGAVIGDVFQTIPLNQDVVLQSYDAQLKVEEGTSTGACTADALLLRQDDSFVAALGRVVALHGRDAALSIRLPDVFVAADQSLKVKVTIANTASDLCHFDIQLRGVKIP